MTEQSVSGRLFAVLDLFLHSPGPLTLSDVSDATQLPMATSYRYLRDLVAWGGLQKTSDGRYRVGPKMWMLGSASSWERTIRRESHPLISAVSGGLHQAVALTMLHRGQIICIDRAWGSTPSIYLVDPGDEIPLPPTSAGKVLLSRLNETELTQTLAAMGARLEPSADVASKDWFAEAYDTTKLLSRVHEARERGYALAAGELRPGQASLSVPVHVPYLETELALSILIPVGYEAAVEFLPHLKDAAKTLGKKLAKAEFLKS
jgi:DNA-binding IclR family transcriptional regulator